MRAPGLYSAFTGSLVLHALLIAVSIIVVRHSNFKRSPASYIVSLVSAPPASSLSADSQKPDVAARPDTQPAKPVMQPPVSQKQKNNTKKEDEKLISERIAALQAKKQVERSATLRKILEIDSKRQAESRSSTARTGQPAARKSTAGGQNSSGGDYDSTVTEKIRQQWIFPENIDRDLEAIVSIKVARDGSITIQKVEKSSGSPLFDRTVLRAIAKAGPLPQPPKEMEIIVRFKP